MKRLQGDNKALQIDIPNVRAHNACKICATKNKAELSAKRKHMPSKSLFRDDKMFSHSKHTFKFNMRSNGKSPGQIHKQ